MGRGGEKKSRAKAASSEPRDAKHKGEKFGEKADAEDSRERFSETAYWNPSIVTGADGKATFKLKAPSSLSDYQFTARGITGADTLAGQAVARLLVRKDFFVDLRTPAALTQGDKPRLIAEVHHQGVAGPAELSLTVYSGGRQDVYPLRTKPWKGDGVVEVMFPAFVVGGDDLRLTLKATAGGRSDEMTIEIPVRPWGVEAYASASGTSRSGSTVFVGLPAGRIYEDADMRITA
jgi:uncharacterized protein YfaS (alpha-2-macroglobulin family)